MAVPTATPASSPSPQLVGKAFVEQYYHVLHRSPELVHKFYLDSSTLSRPNSKGAMTTVTTMEGINDLVLSLDSKSCITEIETADAQPSFKDGVFILVTGCLTGKEANIRRRFTQSFFLAPQDKGAYFVLNDVFRYVEQNQSSEVNQIPINGSNDDVAKAPLDPQHGDYLVQDHQVMDCATPPSEGDLENDDEVCDPSENEGSVVEEEVAVDQPTHPSQNDAPPTSGVMTSASHDDVPKKSYASIVKVLKGSTSTVSVYVPTTKSRPAPVKPEKPSLPTGATASPPEAPASDMSNAHESNTSNDDVEGYSIYIRNLPVNATPAQVEEEFKKFGTIKPGGVQVRSHKVERFCFGFVEFESLTSMQAAIKASPIMIGGRQAYVEEKRTTTRVVNGVITNGSSGGGRGRYPTGRGGFRNDNFRGRGGFGGNQGYVRGDFRNRSEYSNRGEYSSRGEYSNRGRGSASREGYQPRGVQNGNGRTGHHPNGVNQTAVSG